MTRQYDIFEQYPDGSSIWRECVVGQDSALRTLKEAHSKLPNQNQFYAIDISNGATIHYAPPTASNPAAQRMS